MLADPWKYEQNAWERGYKIVCGVDEAGRGPLAGDVFAGACILPPDFDVAGLDDSKKLSEKKRDALYERIKGQAICATARATPEEIDRENILNAALLAMRRAVEALAQKPDILLIDGNRARGFNMPVETIVHGDGLSASIAAASILAKVERDRYMLEMAERYPGYGFEQHKGYPTRAHYEALEKLGPSEIHRKTFLKRLHNVPQEKPAASFSAEIRQLAGKFGENCAADYLEGLGYRILQRNFKTHEGELDIIAQDRSDIVFVEVKLRRESEDALEAVTETKISRMRRAADEWLQIYAPKAVARFDAVEVYIGTPRQSPFGLTFPLPKIYHTRDII